MQILFDIPEYDKNIRIYISNYRNDYAWSISLHKKTNPFPVKSKASTVYSFTSLERLVERIVLDVRDFLFSLSEEELSQ